MRKLALWTCGLLFIAAVGFAYPRQDDAASKSTAELRAYRRSQNQGRLRGLPWVNALCICDDHKYIDMIEKITNHRLANLHLIRKPKEDPLAEALTQSQLGPELDVVVERVPTIVDDKIVQGFHVRLEVEERVIIERNSKHIRVVTWSTGGKGDGNDATVTVDQLPERVNSLLDEFANDLLASNQTMPKKN